MAGIGTVLVPLLHACGLLAVVHLYRDGYRGSELLGYQCKDNTTTCWGRLVDFLPENLLLLEVGFALKWLGIAAAAVYIFYVAASVYRIFFCYVEDRFLPHERGVGYLIPPGKTKAEIANLVRRRLKIGDIPPVYPNGWYDLMRSSELPVGGVKAVCLIGQHFVVFRRENGKVSVMDAYCPHLGANLGVGGHVRGNCIQCPFHGWVFDGETGQCTEVPYAAKVPSFAKVKVWHSVECNGIIFLWFDAEGREPAFHMEQVEEIKSGQWTYRGRMVHHFNAHIEDLSENAADLNHLGIVHEPNITSGAGLDYATSRFADILIHKWTAKWQALPPPQSHISRMNVSMVSKFLWWTLTRTEVHVVADQHGPSVVHLTFNTPIGRGVWIETQVPEEPLFMRMTNYVYADWWMPTFIVTRMLKGMGIQIERDVHLWSNKTYLSKPLLLKEDRLIAAHRRWFSQFYSENSPRLDFKKENDLSW